MATVKDRLIDFINQLEMPVSEFEKVIEVSNGYVRNISKSVQPHVLERISNNFPALNIEWLLIGRGEMVKSEHVLQPDVPEHGLLYPSRPFVDDLKATCGSPNGFSNAILKNGHSMISLPIKADYDFAIEATGLSMMNKKNPELSINPGDFVALKIITSPAYIRWGELYGVATLDDIVVKKIMPSEREGYIKCVSFNDEEYPAYDMPVNEITGWAAVKAIVSVLKF